MPQQVRITKERFLSVSKDTLVSWLVKSLKSEDEKNQFYRLCSSIEALFYAQRVAQIEEIKECYATFDSLNPPLDNESSEIDVEELQRRQNRLLENIFQILQDSNFTPVTYENYTNALKSVYLSDLPIAVDWAKLDSNMFKNFFENHPHLDPYAKEKQAPPFHNHFALFYGGVGSITKENLYFDHKINLLCSRIQSYLKCKLYCLGHYLQGRLYTRDENNTSNTTNSTSPMDSNTMNNHVSNGDDHGLSRYVERVSLADSFDQAEKQGWGALIMWFLSSVKLQEPTFRRIVLVYRSLPEGILAEKLRRAKEDSKKLSRKMKAKFKRHSSDTEEISNGMDNVEEDELDDVIKNNETSEQIQQLGHPQIYNEFQRLQSVTKLQEPKQNDRLKEHESLNEPIRMRYFADVPMADLEVVFPCKRLSLKNYDRIYLIVVIVMGLYYIVQEFFAEHPSTWWHYATVIGAAALVIRAVTWYRTQESLYHAAVTETLFDTNIASDLSVVLSLIDSCNSQDLLETIIAYHALLQDRSKGELKTTEEVDKYCERLLKENMGIDVNVEINDAMKKLKLLGLVEEKIDIHNNSTQLLTVKPLEEGIDCIHRHWMSFTSSFRQLKIADRLRNQTKSDQLEM